jgi:hypothetical protein
LDTAIVLPEIGVVNRGCGYNFRCKILMSLHIFKEACKMNRQMNTKELISKGESETVEFKKSLSLQSEGLKALCAMINSDSSKGLVIFGIEDSGIICGLEPGNLDKAQRSLAQSIRNKFDPQQIVQITLEEIDGNTILLLYAERKRGTPYHEYDGRVWIRQGTENHLLGLNEKQRLNQARNRDNHQGPWRCDRCGSVVGMLVSYEFSDGGMKKSYKCHCGGEFWPA